MAIIMTPLRKKQIADTFSNSRFSSSEFDISAVSQAEFSIIYKKEPHYKFFTDKNSRYEHSPGENGEMKKYSFQQASWIELSIAIANWLTYLDENIQAGDPWAEVENLENDTFNIGNKNEKSFTPEDVNIIDEKLDIILEGLKKFDIDLERIKIDLDYLKFASGEVSKKDWGLMVMGSVMGWGIENVVPKDSLHDVWKIIMDTFGNSQHLIA